MQIQSKCRDVAVKYHHCTSSFPFPNPMVCACRNDEPYCTDWSNLQENIGAQFEDNRGDIHRQDSKLGIQ